MIYNKKKGFKKLYLFLKLVKFLPKINNNKKIIINVFKINNKIIKFEI